LIKAVVQSPVDVKTPSLPPINTIREATYHLLLIIVAAVKNYGNIVARVKELWLHNNNTLPYKAPPPYVTLTHIVYGLTGANNASSIHTIAVRGLKTHQIPYNYKLKGSYTIHQPSSLTYSTLTYTWRLHHHNTKVHHIDLIIIKIFIIFNLQSRYSPELLHYHL